MEGKGRAPRRTGIQQSISVLLEFDAHICAIAKQCRIAGIARYRIGIQLRGSQKVAGYSDKAGRLAGQKRMELDLPSIHEKAWLASALSLAASCLSSSVISLGSAKLSVDSAGDGMADEGGVVEEREGEDDSLMLTITPCGAGLTLFDSICTRALIRSGQTKILLLLYHPQR